MTQLLLLQRAEDLLSQGVFYYLEYLITDFASRYHSSVNFQALFTNIRTLMIVQYGILKVYFQHASLNKIALIWKTYKLVGCK